MKQCTKIKVTGTVQGVFYRDFVKKQASKLEIEGTVQNNKDGSVVINACGLTEKIDLFIDSLYDGPPKSQVEDIFIEPMIERREFRGVFRIIGLGT